MLKRYVGDVVYIKPILSDIKIYNISTEHVNLEQSGNFIIYNQLPCMWYEYNHQLYFSVFNFIIEYFDSINDIENFNVYEPGMKELKWLYEKGVYETFEVDYIGIIQSDLDEYCEFELDFLKIWYRDSQFRKLGII